MSNNFKRRDILHMGLAASALAALPRGAAAQAGPFPSKPGTLILSRQFL